MDMVSSLAIALAWLHIFLSGTIPLPLKLTLLDSLTNHVLHGVMTRTLTILYSMCCQMDLS